MSRQTRCPKEALAFNRRVQTTEHNTNVRESRAVRTPEHGFRQRNEAAFAQQLSENDVEHLFAKAVSSHDTPCRRATGRTHSPVSVDSTGQSYRLRTCSKHVRSFVDRLEARSRGQTRVETATSMRSAEDGARAPSVVRRLCHVGYSCVTSPFGGSTLCGVSGPYWVTSASDDSW